MHNSGEFELELKLSGDALDGCLSRGDRWCVAGSPELEVNEAVEYLWVAAVAEVVEFAFSCFSLEGCEGAGGGGAEPVVVE